MAESESIFVRLARSEGAQLAAIPFFGTLTAFVFEAGYLSYFDVPPSVMQLDFTRIVKATGVLTIFAGYIFMAFLVTGIIVAGRHPIRRALLRPLASAFPIGIMLYITPWTSWKWWLLAAATLAVAAYKLLLPLFTSSRGGTYSERLTELLEKEDQEGNVRSRPDMLANVGMVFFTFLIVFAIGRQHARETESYWTIEGRPNEAIVEIYGDTVVLKPFDPNSKEMGKDVTLLSIAQRGELKLLSEHTGPLLEPEKGSHPAP